MTGPAEPYLGIDLGTSGLKLAMVGSNGSILAESEGSYDVHTPQTGFAETDPAEWAAALESAAEQLVGQLTASGLNPAPRAIGVTGQMHGVVLTGDSGTPVRPAILWPDRRAAAVVDQWTSLDAELRGRLSNPIVAGMPGPVVGWLHEHEEESLQAASHITFPKDWLRGLMTGDRATERSDASATLLWDVVADEWSVEALHLAGVSPEQLPTLVPSSSTVGSVGEATQSQFFERLGWAGVPVVAGAADVACALIALQASGIGDRSPTVVVNLGTGIQILRPHAKTSHRPDALTHLYADADAGWYEMLAVQNGGLALSWVQQVLGLEWADFVAAARSAPAGSAGATFSPFLTGERGLLALPDATGGWSGLTPSVGPAELARSAFEALAFIIRRGIEGLGAVQESIMLTGGGARDPWVRQVICDVLDRPLTYVPLRSGSAVGAAVLAARGVGESLRVDVDAVLVEPAVSAPLECAYAAWLAL